MSKYFPMTILEFSLDLPAQPNQLMKLTEDYENLPKYLPDQLKSVRIIEKNETDEDCAIRELKEETNLEGSPVRILGPCSHFGSIFGDILLIGILMKIKDSSWGDLSAMDDASDAKLFNITDLPSVAFYCHEKIIEFYLELIQNKL